jgi:hypothetical protein
MPVHDRRPHSRADLLDENMDFVEDGVLTVTAEVKALDLSLPRVTRRLEPPLQLLP